MNKIILTAVGAPGGPTIIEALREDKSLHIIGTDMRSEVPAKYMVDEFIQVPAGRSREFIPFMLNLVKEKSVSVILPLATFELDNLAEHKGLFKKEGCNICVSDFKSLNIANNKYKLYETLKDTEFVPKYYLPSSVEEFEKFAKDLGYPNKKIVMRPSVSHGSIGLRIISNEINKLDILLNHKPTNVFSDYQSIIETLKMADEFPEIVLTEYLPNKEYGIDLIFDPQTNKLLKTFIRDNGSVSLSEISGGKSIKTDMFNDIIKAVSEKLKLAYSINIDIKLDENNNPKILEINPRLPATSYLAYKAGFNMSLDSIYLALGKSLKYNKTKDGLSIFSYRGFMVVEGKNGIV